jgi:glutathione S-transferase
MYKLYNVKTWGSLSIHCMLEEMEAPYTNIWMTPDQVRSRDFRKVNPVGVVPALGLADGRVLFESAAIVSFLVAAHPEKRLSPPLGSADYGEFMSILHFMSTELYPATNLSISAAPYAATPEQGAIVAARARERADECWLFLEKRLAASGPWLMGRDYSALDPYAFMIGLWQRPSEEALHARFPAIAKHASAFRARPKLKAVLEAHGVMQPGGYRG